MKFKRTFVPGGGVKSDTQPSPKDKKEKFKNRITKLQSNLYRKCKFVVGAVALSVLINQIPVTADVTDNLSSAIQKLIGAKTDDCGNSFEDSSVHAKLNYQEKQIVALQSSVEELKGQNAAYSLFCYIQSNDTRYEGCELSLTSASGNQTATANLHLNEKLNKYVANIYSNFNGNCTLQYGSVKESINLQATGQEHQLKPYISDLTVWIDSTDSAYNGKTVKLTNEDGTTIETATLALKNGHYETAMTVYANGVYRVTYPYILNSGKVIELSTGVTLKGESKKQQLFGDITQMDISDIQEACRTKTINEIAKVGDTFSDGTYTYTIIGIDQDIPCDANGHSLDKSTYGNVLTVMPMGAEIGKSDGTPVSGDISKIPLGDNKVIMYLQDNGEHVSDRYTYNNGASWKGCFVRTSTMNSYFNTLPETTRNAIGYVQKVTGQHDGNYSEYGNSNITTADKCFLLSEKEVFGKDSKWSTSSERSATFQYQYFESIATTANSRKIGGSSTWWLRSPAYGTYESYLAVSGGGTSSLVSGYKLNALPAFCIY